MEYIHKQCYPEDSKNIIKCQCRMGNGDVYVITYDGIKWKCFLGKKKIGESQDYNKILERIPDDRW